MAVYNPHLLTVKYCPITEAALKYADKEKEERHGQRAEEEHRPPPPPIDI
jgi:hypothetical protein